MVGTKYKVSWRTSARVGFTLIELLITMVIIGILSSVVLAALFAAQESAKASRTKATITKLHNQVMHVWEQYRTRRLPIAFDPTVDGTGANNGRNFAVRRLSALWDTMRLEMPDHYADFDGRFTVHFSPANDRIYVNGLREAYRRYVQAVAASQSPPATEAAFIAIAEQQNASAECLYLTVALSMNADDEVRFLDGEIGDRDQDGMPEFHDGWGRPIAWLRWAPGYVIDAPPPDTHLPPDYPFADTEQVADYHSYADPFDPSGVGRPNAPTPNMQPPDNPPNNPLPPVWGFKLTPLIFSAGPDGATGGRDSQHGLHTAFDPSVAWNPYSQHNGQWRGTPLTIDPLTGTTPPELEGGGYADNITNHRLGNR